MSEQKGNGQAREPWTIGKLHRELGDHARNTHEVWVEPHVSIEEQLRPQAWGPVSEMLGTRDIIYAQARDNSFLRVFRVMRKHTGGADVMLLHEYKFAPLPDLGSALFPDGWKAEQRPDLGWVILRPNGEIFTSQNKKGELTSRVACAKYLAESAIFRGR